MDKEIRDNFMKILFQVKFTENDSPLIMRNRTKWLYNLMNRWPIVQNYLFDRNCRVKKELYYNYRKRIVLLIY